MRKNLLITRKEVIRKLNIFKNTVESDENFEVLNMEIKVLEQESTTKNNLGVGCTPNTISFKEIVSQESEVDNGNDD